MASPPRASRAQITAYIDDRGTAVDRRSEPPGPTSSPCHTAMYVLLLLLPLRVEGVQNHSKQRYEDNVDVFARVWPLQPQHPTFPPVPPALLPPPECCCTSRGRGRLTTGSRSLGLGRCVFAPADSCACSFALLCHALMHTLLRGSPSRRLPALSAVPSSRGTRDFSYLRSRRFATRDLLADSHDDHGHASIPAVFVRLRERRKRCIWQDGICGNERRRRDTQGTKYNRGWQGRETDAANNRRR